MVSAGLWYHGHMDKKLILFTDVGDTIIDEASEVREVPFGVVLHARCVPGAREALLELHRRGYVIAMVADGLAASFENTMRENGLDHVFIARVISETLNSQKPAPEMFRAAMEALGLSDADKGRVIMVGNNLERDIAGANRFGLRSVLLDWSPRYRHEPEAPDEIPDYTIHTPEELVTLAERLNGELETG